MKLKFRKTAGYRLMSLLVIGTLTMTSFGMVQAKSTSTSYQEEAVSSKTTKAKISSRLMKQFQQDDKVTFLIKMKEQTNTQKVAKEAVSRAKKQKLTAAKTQYTKRSAVVSELRATSEETQQALLTYLQKEQKKKQVKEIHSYYIVNGLAVTGTKEVMEKVASFPEVDQVLPNETRQIHRPVDLKTSKQKKQMKAVDGVEWNISQVHAPEAWALGYDGTGTVVASIDTGVEWDHPALKEKYRGFDPAHPNDPSHEFNWYDATTGSEAPYDDLEHGTHVTGTMVGSEPDGKNQIGVAPGAKWIAVKAFSEDGGSDADLLDAGEWILAPKDEDGNPHPEKAPDVVNNSWGGGPGLDDWYKDVVNAWRAADIFPEFSAGNTDLFNPGGEGSIANPANYQEAFATGATDQDNKLGSFSLQGPSPYGVMKPDIAAPGVNIRSSIPGKGYEDGWNGTSMAGPHVSAVVALLRQVQSDLSVEEIEQILIDTAKPLTDQQFPESPNNGYGAGLVDAKEAITALTDGIGTIEGQVTNEDVNLGDMKITDQALPQKEKAVHPHKKPAKTKELKKGKNLDAPSIKALPMKAEISVLESGKSTYTDEATGRYQLTHSAGEFTVKAEAYGFESRKQTVNISSNETAEANFALQPLKKRTISGTIVNEATGEKVKDATVYLVEDAKIKPVKTDEAGEFSLEALSGVYTVKVFAKGFKGYSFTADVTEKPVKKAIQLEPFIGFAGEIGYDDGTAENARAFYDPGNGWAVKFSLEKGKKQAQLTGGLFRFWSSEWPAPGGNEFAVEVYDASGKNGAPGEKIAGPLKANALRNGEWTKVDLEDQAITVDGDFYLVYIQTKKNTESPGLATDEDGPNAERSWQLTSGAFSPSPKEEGNYMIRALVDYEADVPEIISPKAGTISNKGELEIEGKASPGLDVAIYQNDEEIAKVKADQSGAFKEKVTVSSGEHVFTAATVTDKGATKRSKPVKVIIDQTAPALTIDTPKKGGKSNKESLTVEGKVTDDHLDQVTVNGKKATVKDGKYSARILLENGKNTIKVTAKDAAGNKTTKKVNIDVQYEAPEISKLTPAENVHLSSGESVKISFNSREKLDATFVIHMPLTNARSKLQNTTELPLREVSNGTYEGYWTATSTAKAKGAVIEVIVRDDYGNVTRQKASGTLNINEK
ncbi:S8 family serine peptidase [Bacillus pumilus]|uniref:S8 family peptidase n=1 Tax=Bacillus pumilus TaxID=1408 RepID=UPI0023D9DE26|nr:S8 family peptidase [Bacillus pumilus]MDF2001902.1 S8 family serine peptidase [Bacillus pumilus]MDF2023157.1 S8 family serine peptidase [Bacillus pumilus]MDF2026784.1 S8 family serine peptidase [Bacillus pumilus]MDF2087967.1 S8 family serine peptidase [Bacillus pumilus]